MAVEPLARRLGVTKGSFYHHFADREALWASLLATFEAEGTEALITAASAVADPRERLRGLFAAAWDDPRRLLAHRALLGSRRPDVAEVLARVHGRRRAFLVECYRELGLRRKRAEQLAATAYASFLGAVLLADQPPFDAEDTLRAWVESVTELLVPG